MLIQHLPALAAHNAGADAVLHFEGQQQTYADLAQHCQRLSRALAASQPAGARVAVLSANRLEFLAAYFGIPGAGMVMLPLNTRLGPQDLAHILDDAEPALLLLEPGFLPLLGPLLAGRHAGLPLVFYGDAPAGQLAYGDWLAAHAGLAEAGQGGAALTAAATNVAIGPATNAATDATTAAPTAAADDMAPAWLLYTSGTTGRPKGALLSHRNLMASALNTLCGFDLGRHEVALFMFPMFHIAGYVLLAYLLKGYAIVLMRGFEAQAYLAAVQRHRISHHSIAPTMLAMVLEHPQLQQHDTSSLRYIIYGASAMPDPLIRAAMRQWPGVGFGTGFGMTELAGNVLYLSREAHLQGLADQPALLAACGAAMPLARVRLLDGAGQDVPIGQPGELAVQGDQVFLGYWRNQAANAAAFIDGWFLTGDIGWRDVRGMFTLVDRKKDMIISGGENIYSREVENLLLQHPAVAEVAVVGAPHALWGEQVVALLRWQAGAARLPGEALAAGEVADAAATLDAFCKARIAGYKRPRRYVLLDALPKSAAGKILKAQLRQQLLAGAFDTETPR